MGHAARHSPGLDGGNALRQAGRPYLPPGPGGHLAGSTRGAPPQRREAGALAPRCHLEPGAWRTPARLLAVSQETPTQVSEATPIRRPAVGQSPGAHRLVTKLVW